MSLADKIHVNTRYTRSINVERDRGSPSIVEAYLPTTRSIDLIEDVAAAFGPKDQPRAWSLIGPYGSGKSSFALFLHELLGPTGSAKTAAAKVLAGEHPTLARRFARQGAWCRVVLTGSEEPLATHLLAALDDAATGFWAGKPGRKPAVIEAIRRARKQRKVADSRLLTLVDSLQTALERNGAGGLLIVIDELGKFLEYEVRQGGGGVFLLQQLAERAFRGRKANLMFFVLLHQGFDLYARGMGERLKNDWAKVQGRFENVSFVETPEQTLRVVAAAFSNSLNRATTRIRAEENHADRQRRFPERKACRPGSKQARLPTSFRSCYPIHPIALLALPQLCQRFAQKRADAVQLPREPGAARLPGLARVLDQVRRLGPPEPDLRLLRPQSAGGLLADPLTHRRWAEVVTAVDRVESADGLAESKQRGQTSIRSARQDGGTY